MTPEKMLRRERAERQNKEYYERCIDNGVRAANAKYSCCSSSIAVEPKDEHSSCWLNVRRDLFLEKQPNGSFLPKLKFEFTLDAAKIEFTYDVSEDVADLRLSRWHECLSYSAASIEKGYESQKKVQKLATALLLTADVRASNMSSVIRQKLANHFQKAIDLAPDDEFPKMLLRMLNEDMFVNF